MCIKPEAVPGQRHLPDQGPSLSASLTWLWCSLSRRQAHCAAGRSECTEDPRLFKKVHACWCSWRHKIIYVLHKLVQYQVKFYYCCSPSPVQGLLWWGWDSGAPVWQRQGSGKESWQQVRQGLGTWSWLGPPLAYPGRQKNAHMQQILLCENTYIWLCVSFLSPSVGCGLETMHPGLPSGTRCLSFSVPHKRGPHQSDQGCSWRHQPTPATKYTHFTSIFTQTSILTDAY